VAAENEELKGVLPRSYSILPNATLVELLRLLVPLELEGDAFGKIYEYFLGELALVEGQKGGVFYTPTSIVRLIVESIEPFRGRILDPACGSGGVRHRQTPANSCRSSPRRNFPDTGIRARRTGLAKKYLRLLFPLSAANSRQPVERYDSVPSSTISSLVIGSRYKPIMGQRAPSDTATAMVRMREMGAWH
jgi:N-6 DNA Methylase